ncbi:hypothetical protein BDN72DRAFT_833051 [Pluteus cervinus]|uniref:Uncharacterized protein n=1 Tax=Pluteus cervinus TaxID=181527 RepID=A0ACD3B9P7_9AGAR|nr:hypothetical protein BDN72DRAFT_833051 [Pluteus cervinus]
MYPLSVFASIPDDLNKMDSRISMKHLNLFMKNTIIRGLNTVYAVAPSISSDHSAFPAFMAYTKIVLIMVMFHLDGDEAFFTRPFNEKECLLNFLGSASVAKNQPLVAAVADAQKRVGAWIIDPKDYTADTLRAALEFGGPLTEALGKQLDSMNNECLEKIVSHEALHLFIEEHLKWLTTKPEVTILVPFIVGHHDFSTNQHWPGLSAEGNAALPHLVAMQPEAWKFAPVDPLTKAPQNWKA